MACTRTLHLCCALKFLLLKLKFTDLASFNMLSRLSHHSHTMDRSKNMSQSFSRWVSSMSSKDEEVFRYPPFSRHLQTMFWVLVPQAEGRTTDECLIFRPPSTSLPADSQRLAPRHSCVTFQPEMVLCIQLQKG